MTAQMKATAKALVENCRNGRDTEGLDVYYREDAVSVEASPMPGSDDGATQGLAGIKGKHEWWHDHYDVNEVKVSGPFYHGEDQFGVIFEMDTTDRASGQHMHMQELAIYTTDADGKMVLVGDLTKEQLEGAPGFDRSVFDRDQTASTDMTSGEDKAEDEMANAEERMDTDETMTSAMPKMETVPAAQAKLEADEIIGMSVIDADNETVGEVADILIDDGGKVEAFIIDVGGFLGMNEKPVAVSMDDLQFARAEGSDDWSTIKTGLTKESLENQQAYTEDQYMSDKESVILIAPVE